jgi:hypothetical protein
MTVAEGRLPVVGQVLVQLFVLFGRNVFGRTLPQRGATVDGLELVFGAGLQ